MQVDTTFIKNEWYSPKFAYEYISTSRRNKHRLTWRDHHTWRWNKPGMARSLLLLMMMVVMLINYYCTTIQCVHSLMVFLLPPHFDI